MPPPRTALSQSLPRYLRSVIKPKRRKAGDFLPATLSQWATIPGVAATA
ncbi:hypothetical protein ABI_26900 [Asticcacaulis biprosthecium C19]|uniref:Uncharacterized protein n=1 Tax=Asticcacaulis biprosthecium C19 TaxID=715226 RepID=F4QPL7_9CAUL|nr:hypothetical protein ABI_26900 [Asticcacaulis biprosthecium C19]